MKKILLLLLSVVFCQSFFGQEISAEGPFDQLIIRGVTLINGNGAPPMGPVDVVIEKNRITQIVVVGYPGVKINEESRPQLQDGGREIDAHNMYLLPGFIDMHAHIGGVSLPSIQLKIWRKPKQ